MQTQIDPSCNNWGGVDINDNLAHAALMVKSAITAVYSQDDGDIARFNYYFATNPDHDKVHAMYTNMLESLTHVGQPWNGKSWIIECSPTDNGVNSDATSSGDVTTLYPLFQTKPRIAACGWYSQRNILVHEVAEVYGAPDDSSDPTMSTWILQSFAQGTSAFYLHWYLLKDQQLARSVAQWIHRL